MFSNEHNKKVAKIVRDNHGIELTPEQVDADRREAFAAIRQQMIDRGWTLPDDDEELVTMIRKIFADDRNASPFSVGDRVSKLGRTGTVVYPLLVAGKVRVLWDDNGIVSELASEPVGDLERVEAQP